MGNFSIFLVYSISKGLSTYDVIYAPQKLPRQKYDLQPIQIQPRGMHGQKEKLRCVRSGVFEERKAGEVLALYHLDTAGFGILFCLLHFVVPVEPVVLRLRVLLGIFLDDFLHILQITVVHALGISAPDGQTHIFKCLWGWG